jgi:hypothetical protein
MGGSHGVRRPGYVRNHALASGGYRSLPIIPIR